MTTSRHETEFKRITAPQIDDQPREAQLSQFNDDTNAALREIDKGRARGRQATEG